MTATWNPTENLALPLEIREPTEIDVVGLFDGSDADIAGRFAVMAAGPCHRFRALTDRLDQAREWFAWFSDWVAKARRTRPFWKGGEGAYLQGLAALYPDGVPAGYTGWPETWPLRYLMLGATIRTQADADRLLPALAELPSRWRFVRVEPVEDIDLSRWRPCTSCKGASAIPSGQRCGECFGKGGSATIGLDLVEIAGGLGPEQLQLVRDIGGQVLDAQTWAPCPEAGCIMGAHVDAVPPEGGVAPVCGTCKGEAQVMSGPALAIVAADVCRACSGTPRFRECGVCTGTDGSVRVHPSVAVPGHGIQVWKQQPIGWWS